MGFILNLLCNYFFYFSEPPPPPPHIHTITGSQQPLLQTVVFVHVLLSVLRVLSIIEGVLVQLITSSSKSAFADFH